MSLFRRPNGSFKSFRHKVAFVFVAAGVASFTAGLAAFASLEVFLGVGIVASIGLITHGLYGLYMMHDRRP